MLIVPSILKMWCWGFGLKGVFPAECFGAMVWYSKQQHDIIGKAHLPTLDCFETVVDSEANTAAVWVLSSTVVDGNHQIQSRGVVRLSMDGDKISGFHMLYDTYQVFALSEELGFSGWLQSQESARGNVVALATEREARTASEEAASSVGRAVQSVCGFMSAMGHGHLKLVNQELVKAASEKFTGMMADKVHCSQMPHNPVLGYDLKDVPYAECLHADMKSMKLQNDLIGGMKTGYAACIETVIDTEANTAAIWLEMNIQDEQGNHLLTTRQAVRLNMDGSKIAGYHTVFDTYQLFALAEFRAREGIHAISLPISSVARAVDGFCDFFIAMGTLHEAHRQETQAVLERYGAMMAETVDCSVDPNNPELGFDLKDVSWAKCSEATMQTFVAQHELVGAMKTQVRCIKKVEDMEANSAAVWIEMRMQDEQGNHMFTTRGAVRLDTNGDKIIGSHWIYDSYQLYALADTLARERAEAVSLSGIVSSWGIVAVAITLTGTLALVVALRNRKKDGRYALLAEVNA